MKCRLGTDTKVLIFITFGWVCLHNSIIKSKTDENLLSRHTSTQTKPLHQYTSEKEVSRNTQFCLLESFFRAFTRDFLKSTTMWLLYFKAFKPTYLIMALKVTFSGEGFAVSSVQNKVVFLDWGFSIISSGSNQSKLVRNTWTASWF